MKIRPVGAELFHTDGRTDRHDERDSLFRNFASAPLKKVTERKSKKCIMNENYEIIFFFR